MNTVWKYTLPYADDMVVLEMPKGAKILSIQEQNTVITLWADVDPNASLVKRTIRWAGTGHPIDHYVCFIGTVQQHGGQLVWHFFDMGEEYAE